MTKLTKPSSRHLDAFDRARAHAVRLCSRPLALTPDPFLRHLMPAEETPDRKNWLQNQKIEGTKFNVHHQFTNMKSHISIYSKLQNKLYMDSSTGKLA